MKKLLGKKTLTALTVLLVVVLFSMSAFAAPAVVTVEKSTFELTYIPEGSILEYTTIVKQRVQTVVLENKVIVNSTLLNSGTAVNTVTGESYVIKEFMKQITPGQPDTFNIIASAMQVAPGPNNNMKVAMRMSMKDGELVKNVMDVEIR